MRIRLSVPDGVIDGPTIDAALEAATRGNEALAARGLLPDLGDALAKGLRWRPEPWEGERFDLATDVAARGWGDCDDLAPWLAAQLRASGENARAFVRKSGRGRWHALVEREDGRLLDPSKWAGMPDKGGGREITRNPARSVAGPGIHAICGVPHQGRWHVRADLPLTDRLHLAGWARDRDARNAVARALAPYALLAEAIHAGQPGVSGPDTVGIGLGDIISAAAPIAGGLMGGPLGAAAGSALGPMAGGLVSSLMGGGGGSPPPAAQAERVQQAPPPGWPPSAQTYAIPGPGGQGGARATFCPGGGPIIVRF